MKKIALITHSYHKFTKSGQMYADEIFGDKNKFIIDYYFNDEWEGNPNYKKFSSRINDYDLVILVQLISKSLLQNIDCKNIIFIPMYDHSRHWGLNEWIYTANLKILSPSIGIYESLKKLGLNSLKIKLFPEPDNYQNQDFNKIFFWNRVETLDYKTVITLLKNYKIKNLNIHQNHDPNHTPPKPQKEEIDKYNITFSNWFENRSDYLDFLDNFGIYIAPRPFEGDGASFIDSMKKGKIVIAPNNHPYVDYIENFKNGILYDLSNPEEIILDDINLEEVSINAYNSVVQGREDWIKSLTNIHDYVFSDLKAGNTIVFKTKKWIFMIKKLIKSYLNIKK